MQKTLGIALFCSISVFGFASTLNVVAAPCATPVPAGQICNEATITSGTQDPDTSNNTASDTDPINYVSDLAISTTTQTASNEIFPGSPLDYTITVTNNGPSTVTSVILSDIVPNGLNTPTFTPPAGASYDPNTGILSGINLAPGQSLDLLINAIVNPTQEADITGTAEVSPPAGVTDSVIPNNTTPLNFNVTPIADMSLTKVSCGNLVSGSNCNYTLTGTNNGPSTADPTIRIVDTLPAGLTYVSFSDPNNEGWTCSASGQTVTCENPNAMADGSTRTVVITTRVN